MFGTVAYNQEPVQGPEEGPVVKEHKLRDWMKQQTQNEERLDFNKNFQAVDETFRARHDQEFLLPDAFRQLAPVPVQPELHGQYSTPVAGQVVPGFVNPRLTAGTLVNNSDMVPNNLDRGTGRLSAIPDPLYRHKTLRKPGMGDMLNNEKMIGALKKMLFQGTAADKDLNMREANQFFGRPWRGI